MFWKRVFSLICGACLVFALAGTASAATIDDFVSGAPVYAPDSNNAVFVISNKLDFADIDNYANGGVTTADVVQALRIPAGMIVQAVGWRVNTAYTTSSCSGYSWDVGDGSDADGWLTEFYFSGNASGVSSTYEDGVAGVYQTTDGGKYYSAADTIDITVQTIAAGTIGTWLDDDPESFATDFVCEFWAQGIMAPTQKEYGGLR